MLKEFLVAASLAVVAQAAVVDEDEQAAYLVFLNIAVGFPALVSFAALASAAVDANWGSKSDETSESYSSRSSYRA